MSKPSIIPFDRNATLEPWPDFPESEIAAGDRGSRGHFWFKDDRLGLSAGIWEADANLGRWMNWPVDEFILVLEGEVVMVEADRETVFGPGDSFIIPRGCRCIWNQCGYFKKFMMMFDGPALASVPATPRVIAINPDSGACAIRAACRLRCCCRQCPPSTPMTVFQMPPGN